MLWVCRACTAACAPEQPRCPHCGAEDWIEQGSEEQNMPKITRAAGATYAEGETPEDAQQLAEALEAADPDQPQLTDLTDDAEDYGAWTYNDLQAECKARGLTATGSHQVLADRLAEDDQATGRP